ncbi:MAG TPA: hypothetical protein VGD56_08455, partial [Gemmatirosa sp.]
MPDTAAPLVEALVPTPDPAACCEALGGLPYRVFLDSAAAGPHGRYSFLSADPVAVVRSAGPVTEVLDRRARVARRVAGDALDP